jgi:hypothetical protein
MNKYLLNEIYSSTIWRAAAENVFKTSIKKSHLYYAGLFSLPLTNQHNYFEVLLLLPIR